MHCLWEKLTAPEPPRILLTIADTLVLIFLPTPVTPPALTPGSEKMGYAAADTRRTPISAAVVIRPPWDAEPPPTQEGSLPFCAIAIVASIETARPMVWRDDNGLWKMAAPAMIDASLLKLPAREMAVADANLERDM